MNCRIYALLWTITVCLVFLSCNKEPDVITGDASVSYESGGYLNVLTNYKVNVGGGGTAKLYVENADPYRDLVGSIIHKNEEANGASNLVLSDLNCTTISMSCRNELEMDTYLTDARLVVYDNDGEQRTVLADLVTFDVTTKLLNFNVNSGDYSDFFNDFTSKVLYFEFDFNGLSPTNIDVTYQLMVESAYTFDLEK